MKIAWIGPYDINSISHRIDQKFDKPFHPATWIKNAANALVKIPGIELHILMHDKRFKKDYRFTENGIHFHLFKTPLAFIPRPLALYQLDRWKFYKELAIIKPDIVHGHGTENLFSYVAVTSGYPNVISIQAIIKNLIKEYPRKTRQYYEHLIVQFVETFTIKNARNIIIKAPFSEKYVKEINPSAKVTLIENIVNQQYFKVTRKVNQDKKSLLFIGSVSALKGIEELISAFELISKKVLDIELYIVGVGEHSYIENRIKPMIEKFSNSDKIKLLGHKTIPQIAELLSSADMLVLPSYSDTSPNVVAEAMAAGVPVVGTNVGGIPFMIDDNETGLVVPVRNYVALAEAILKILGNKEMAQNMSLNAKRRSQSRYGEDSFTKKILNLYNEIINSEQEGGHFVQR